MKQPNDEKRDDVMKPQPRFGQVSVEVLIEPMPQDVMVAYPTLCGGTNTCYALPQLEA